MLFVHLSLSLSLFLSFSLSLSFVCQTDDTCFEAPPGLSEEEAQRKFLEECETTDWSLLGSAKAANTVKEISKAMKGVELEYWL